MSARPSLQCTVIPTQTSEVKVYSSLRNKENCPEIGPLGVAKALMAYKPSHCTAGRAQEAELTGPGWASTAEALLLLCLWVSLPRCLCPHSCLLPPHCCQAQGPAVTPLAIPGGRGRRGSSGTYSCARGEGPERRNGALGAETGHRTSYINANLCKKVCSVRKKSQQITHF